MNMNMNSVLLLVATFATVVVATPPACLLACVASVNRQHGQYTLNRRTSICSAYSTQIDDCLTSICPSSSKDGAKVYFKKLCTPKSKVLKKLVFSNSTSVSSTTSNSSNSSVSSSTLTSKIVSGSTTLAAEATTSTLSNSTDSAATATDTATDSATGSANITLDASTNSSATITTDSSGSSTLPSDQASALANIMSTSASVSTASAGQGVAAEISFVLMAGSILALVL